MPNSVATKTSFQKGQKPTRDMIEKRKATIQQQILNGEYKYPATGSKWSKESKEKRSATRRKNSLGHKYLRKDNNTIYWQIMTNEGRKYEHRVIMEDILGRKLLKSEHVHHLNKNTLDNSPENLKLLTASDHTKEHFGKMTKEQLINRASSLKLKEGQWSRKYNCCQKCGTIRTKHVSNGICCNCNEKQRRLQKKVI